MNLLFTFLNYAPVVCTICLAFVFLIYDMCQVCLSRDRVEVQYYAEQIIAGLALTKNHSNGEGPGSFLVAGY